MLSVKQGRIKYHFLSLRLAIGPVYEKGVYS